MDFQRNPTKQRLTNIAAITVTVALALIVLSPLLWMIHQALQDPATRFDFPPSLTPRRPSFGAFREVFSGKDMPRWLVNTTLVAFGAACLSVILGSWGAYGISRFRTRGTTLFSFLILTTQMMPPVVLMIPLFRAVLAVNLNDSLVGLTLSYVIFYIPVTTWMIKSAFDSVPQELEEAAMVDGCTRAGALRRIVLPLALPGVLAAGVFSFAVAWSEFLFARTIITDPRQWVGSIGIASFFGEYGTPWDQVMAAAIIITLPPLILFLVVQRYFVGSLAGGVKG
jgi:multiple sugar transport system permease protein